MTYAVEILIPDTIDKSFTYSYGKPLIESQRVAIKFGRGNRMLEGYVLSCKSYKKEDYTFSLKEIHKVLEETPLLTLGQWKLALWLKSYYLYPLADILKAMIPASLKSQKKIIPGCLLRELVEELKSIQSLSKKKFTEIFQIVINEDPDFNVVESFGYNYLTGNWNELKNSYQDMVNENPLNWIAVFEKLLCILESELSISLKSQKKILSTSIDGDKLLKIWVLVGIFNKKNELSDLTFKKNWHKYLKISNADKLKSYNEILKSKWLLWDKNLTSREEAQPIELPRNFTPESEKILTAKQRKSFEEIVEFLQNREKKPILFRGLTGSGKTEIYLQLIRVLFEEDPSYQIMMMVPEIGLTPQMLDRFEARFPGKVSLVHSAMGDKERWLKLQEIRTGNKKILIGPRSLVLAGFLNLRFIIVDEEHDQSYKQGSGFLYHGRDVSVVRSSLEKIDVLLASATPSIESYYNSRNGKYRYVELTERILGRSLPEIKVIKSVPAFTHAVKVDLESNAPTSSNFVGNCYLPIGKEIIEAVQEKISQKEQVIIIVNRKGYSNYLYSLSKNNPVSCPSCSITLKVYHQIKLLRCHYCDYQISVKNYILKNPEEKFASVGYGSEKVFDFFSEKFPDHKIKMVDSDTPKNKLAEILEKFQKGGLDLLIGTQILSKGHDFPLVTLTVVLEVDHLLSMPDFRGGERTFQLLVQAAGRSGRDTKKGQVIFQSVKPEHPVIQKSVEQDYIPFAQMELGLREQIGFPPFAKLVLIDLSSKKLEVLNQFCGEISHWLEELMVRIPDIKKELMIIGPVVPPIEKIREKFRRTILIRSENLKPIWKFLILYKQNVVNMPSSITQKIDVDPQVLL